MNSERTFPPRRRSRRAVVVGVIAALTAPAVLATRPADAAPVTIDLCAIAGSTSLPTGAAVPIWTYVPGTCVGATAPTVPGGPTIVVDQGDVVTVTLHNALGEATGLLFQGQALPADTTGAAALTGARTYTFTASSPGTYLYEAALLPNAHHQVAMGLYGALVVRSAVAGTAYGTAATAYDQDAVVLLSEIDPGLNTKAGGPATFDMRNYRPRYRLVNGRAHPATAAIAASAGGRLLLRYVNAGVDSHSLSVLGLRQLLVGNDGNGLAHPHPVVAETLGSGQTLDAVAAIPASAATGTRYPLYDAALAFHNNTQRSVIGGMLTTIEVTVPSGLALVSNLVATPGGFDAVVTATAPATVQAAEYFVDTAPGAPGTGLPVGALLGSPVSVSVAFGAPVTAVGTHAVHVRGQDSNGVWGPVASTTFTIGTGDPLAPTTSGLTLTPSPATPVDAVAIAAAASDVATGGSAIAAAELTLDYGTPVAMTVAPTGSATAALSATIPAGLSLGNHTVSVRSRDAAGNWSAAVTATLPVTAPADATGPATSAVGASPNPNNGSLPYSASTPAVRVFATVTDAVSAVAAAEGFIDPVGTPAVTTRGFVFNPADGAWSAGTEAVYADIPLTTVAGLAAGPHTIGVRGRDAAGNWTTTLVSTVLVIDKVAPTVVGITRVDPTPTGAATVQFTVTFSEAVSGVAAGNFALVAGGGLTGAGIVSIAGVGVTRTVTVSTGSGGTLGLNLTSAAGITDLAGNGLAAGLPIVGPVYTVLSPPLYFSTFGNTNPPGAGGTADDADVYFWNGLAFSRSVDVTTLANPLPAGANVDGLDRVDATHFYLSFAGQVTVPGLGPVQDEDVVYYDAGTWTLFFDGSVRGLAGASATDLDAISVVGGTLYFSTDNAAVPPGAGGAGDDADIYRWNGASSFTRVADASALGWSTADVDGLEWVDATHVHLSYSADTTVPGLGAVQDEDVVRLNGAVWSGYFEGTAKGLTNGNQDVDAFDLP